MGVLRLRIRDVLQFRHQSLRDSRVRIWIGGGDGVGVGVGVGVGGGITAVGGIRAIGIGMGGIRTIGIKAIGIRTIGGIGVIGVRAPEPMDRTRTRTRFPELGQPEPAHVRSGLGSTSGVDVFRRRSFQALLT